MNKNNYLDIVLQINESFVVYSSDSLRYVSEHLLDEDVCRYLFSFLAKKENAIDWFFDFYDAGYFKAEKDFFGKKQVDKNFVYWWNALPYLDKVSELNKQKNNNAIANKLLEIVNDIQEYYYDNKLLENNSVIWSYCLRILQYIPNELIHAFCKNKNIKIVNDWFDLWVDTDTTYSLILMDLGEKLFPKFLTKIPEDYQVLEGLFALLTQIKWEESEGESKPRLMMRDYWIETQLLKKKKDIAQYCQLSLIFQLADKLTEIYKKDKNGKRLDDKYSYMWLPLLDGEPEYKTQETHEELSILLKDLVIEICRLDSNKGKEIIKEFFSDKYGFVFLRRIALFCIVANWVKYSDLFEQFLRITKNPLLESSYEAEMEELFEVHAKELASLKYFERIKSLIISPNLESITEKYLPYYQQRWASWFKDIDEELNVIYIAQQKVTKCENLQSIAEERLESNADWVKSESPISKEQMLGMDISDLIKRFQKIPSKAIAPDRWIEMEDIGEALRFAVAEKPEYFINNLSDFIVLDPEYPMQIIWGFREAFNKGNELDWSKILNFCGEYFDYIKNNGFKEEVHRGFFDFFSGLIQDASNNDEKCFDDIYLDRVKELLLKVLSIYPYCKPKVRGDKVTTALNTAYGRIICATFSFTLHSARILKIDKNPERIEWIKSIYDDLFSKSVLEAYIFFGRHLANYCYINQKWAHKRINDFMKLDISNECWQWYIEGYLKGGKLYKDLYKMSREHYEKAIKFTKNNKYRQLNRRLAEHLSIGYLWEEEKLEDSRSLFKIFLDKKDFEVYQDTVDFFWSYHKEIEKNYADRKAYPDKEKNERIEGVRTKICLFWKWTYENRKRLKEDCREKYSILLSDLSRLILFVENIDEENIQWLLESAPYVDENYHGSFFWKYLMRFKGNKDIAKYLSLVILELAKNFKYMHQDKDVKMAIENLYKCEEKERANEICNILSRKGHENLVLDLYTKYNG